MEKTNKDGAAKEYKKDTERDEEVAKQDQMGKVDGSEEPQDNEEDDETECGFCLFMKGGGCKESFIAWEKCTEEAKENEEDMVEKCFDATVQLRKCMAAHADYYEPILRIERGMDEETNSSKDVEKEAVSDTKEAGNSTNRT